MAPFANDATMSASDSDYNSDDGDYAMTKRQQAANREHASCRQTWPLAIACPAPRGAERAEDSASARGLASDMCVVGGACTQLDAGALSG